MARESFVLYGKFQDPIMRLSLESRGVLMTAIFEYHNTGREIEMSMEVQMAFLFIKNQLDLDSKKYDEACNKKVANGKKGADKRWGNGKNSTCHNSHSKNGNTISNIAKMADNENENGNDNDNYNINTNDNTEKRKKLKKEKVLSLVPRIGNWNPHNEDVLIDKNWVLDFTDPVFVPYAKVPDSIKKDVEKWVRREKCGTLISKRFIAEQFTNFARRQGKISELLRTT